MTIAENNDINAWLAKERAEPVLEPELPIIDAHHHLWDIRRAFPGDLNQTFLEGFAVLEAFGPHRCMFESNFPVDRECISYRTLWNLFKKIAAKLGLSEAEKTAVFSGTAARAYRLTPP